MNEKIKWTNHVSSLLQNIRIKAPYTDAYLACSGKVYEVHRVILSSCSDVFQEIFKQTTNETPFIIIANVKSKYVEYLLNYMYRGEVNIGEKEIEELLDAAEYFKIKGLSQAVLNKEPSNISKYSRETNASVISDLTFSPPRKKKKLGFDASSFFNKKNQGNIFETYPHPGVDHYPTYTHTDVQSTSKSLSYPESGLTIPSVPNLSVLPVQSQPIWKESEAKNTVDIIPKSNTNVDSNHSTHVWNVNKGLSENYGNTDLLTSIANTYTKNQDYQPEKSDADIKDSQSDDNYSGDDSLSDCSELYSSDEDPIMALKIKKIVKKTYKTLLTKFKGQNNFRGCSLQLQGRSLITLSTVSKGDGRRHSARVNYCYFCNSPQTQIWRHIKNVHKAEPQVTRICDLRGNSEQKQEIEFLRNMGNFYHNKEVLNAGNGELKVYRRLDNNTQLSYKDFIPCPKCLLFLSRNDLWRHYKYKCMPQSVNTNGRVSIGHLGHLLFMSSVILGMNTNFKKAEKKIVARLKTDEISDIAIKDEVIMHLGCNLFENVREDRFCVVDQSMRLSARILLYVRRRLNQQYLTLYHVLRPSYFAYISEAVDVLSRYLQTEEPSSFLASLSSPELAYQLANLVRKCLAVKLGMALRAHNEDDKVDTNCFVGSLDKLIAGFASFSSEDKNLSMLEVDMDNDVVIIEDNGPEFLNEEIMWEGNRVFDRELQETVSAITGGDVSISPPNARSVAALKRVPYTPSENEAIFKYFGDLIEKNQMIRKEDIDRLFTNPNYAGELNNRSWKNIKYKIHNIIQKKNKQSPITLS